MAGPTISVITVTRNLVEAGRVESVRAALACVQEQVGGACEHVIWDGASTDGTTDLLRDMIEEITQQPGVPIRFHVQADQSLYDAMNRAAGLCSGDYLIFLNSDDLLAAPDCLAQARKALGSDRPDFCFGETVYREADGHLRYHRIKNVHSILQRIPFCHNSMLIRKDVFDSFNGHDLRYQIVADYDLVLRMMLAGRSYRLLPVYLAVFHPGGLSSDRLRVAKEMTQSWAANYAPFMKPGAYDAEDMLNWYRVGQLPLRLCLSMLLGARGKPQLRRAAWHSLGVTLRRRLQPWRSWDNLAG